MTDREWIAANKATLNAQHPGKWVAVKNEAVVGTGATATAAGREAAAAGKTEPALYKTKKA